MKQQSIFKCEQKNYLVEYQFLFCTFVKSIPFFQAIKQALKAVNVFRFRCVTPLKVILSLTHSLTPRLTH